MTTDALLRLVHVLTVGFFGGSLLSMLFAQGLLTRAATDAARLDLARAAHLVARTVTLPLAYLGFLSGLALMLSRYSLYGAGKVMSCAPVYVHFMLLFGFLAVGMAEMWKARARKLCAALDGGEAFATARSHLARGWMFAVLALAFILAAFVVTMFQVPNPARTRCVAQALAQAAASLPV